MVPIKVKNLKKNLADFEKKKIGNRNVLISFARTLCQVQDMYISFDFLKKV